MEKLIEQIVEVSSELLYQIKCEHYRQADVTMKQLTILVDSIKELKK